MTRTKFLDPAAIDSTLCVIAELARSAKTKAVLIGGCALQLYGSDRFTKDIDIATSNGAAFGPGKAVTVGGRRVLINKVPVDVIERSDVYKKLYEAAIATAQSVEGSAIPVARLEYLGAMKLAAGRGKDQQDLAFVLLDTAVNSEELRKVVEKYLGIYAAEELDGIRVVAELERQGKRLPRRKS